jgi:methionyl aminopeptidase
MSVQTPEELAALRRAGRAVSATLRVVARRVRPGVTTAELDAVAARALARHGARPAPALLYGLPGAMCTSVDDEAVHGIPGRAGCGPASWSSSTSPPSSVASTPMRP